MQQDNPALTSVTAGGWERRVWIPLGALTLWSQALIADPANLSLKLTIAAPPYCTVSTIPVDFEDVQAAQIDGVNYKRMRVPYNLNCGNLSGAVKITLSGAGATFSGGAGALDTSLPNLGIAFYNGTTRLNLGSGVNFVYSNPPNLFAVPLKASGYTFTSGSNFSAGAILTVTYN